jgi:RNA polymerase sigma factor
MYEFGAPSLPPAVLSKQLTEAKHDRTVLNHLISAYLPFIRKTVAGVFFKRQEQEENLSDGMLGFLQSVNTYQPERGAFISYCQTVIRHRLLNAAYKEKHFLKRHKPLNDEVDEAAAVELAQRNYELMEERKNIRSEIELINDEFSAWGFDISDLVKQRPKQELSWETCQGVAAEIMAHSYLTEEVNKRRQLPISWLKKATGFSEKVLDKYRRYIAALVIIETGDYPYIRSFLPHQFF